MSLFRKKEVVSSSIAVPQPQKIDAPIITATSAIAGEDLPVEMPVEKEKREVDPKIVAELADFADKFAWIYTHNEFVMSPKGTFEAHLSCQMLKMQITLNEIRDSLAEIVKIAKE